MCVLGFDDRDQYVWNRNYIDSCSIGMAERIGVRDHTKVYRREFFYLLDI